MKTEYKYIHFIKIEDKPKTSIWMCHNNNSSVGLGRIKWNSGWRQYCYYPRCEAVYSVGCLEDINHFINQLEIQRKEKKHDQAINKA